LCGYHMDSFDSCEDIEFLAAKKPRQKGVAERRDFHIEVVELNDVGKERIAFFE
jgi:hypothetical protein